MFISEEQIQANKEEFLALINSIEREFNKDILIKKLSTSDFFIAPASTKYHMDCKGGLCQHSLNVYHALDNLVKQEPYCNVVSYHPDTIKLVALLHDISKMDLYEIDARNIKVRCPEGSKVDELGHFEWTCELFYKVKEPEERFQYGTHGETARYMASKLAPLTIEEEVAIREHMGGMDTYRTYNEMTDASALTRKYPLIALLHAADYLVTFAYEGREILEKADEQDN